MAKKTAAQRARAYTSTPYVFGEGRTAEIGFAKHPGRTFTLDMAPEIELVAAMAEWEKAGRELDEDPRSNPDWLTDTAETAHRGRELIKQLLLDEDVPDPLRLSVQDVVDLIVFVLGGTATQEIFRAITEETAGANGSGDPEEARPLAKSSGRRSSSSGSSTAGSRTGGSASRGASSRSSSQKQRAA